MGGKQGQRREKRFPGGSRPPWRPPSRVTGSHRSHQRRARAVLSSRLWSCCFLCLKKGSPGLSSVTVHIPSHLSTSNTNVSFSAKLLPVPPGCLDVLPTHIYFCLYYRMHHKLTYSSYWWPRRSLTGAASSSKAGTASAFYIPDAASNDRNTGGIRKMWVD